MIEVRSRNNPLSADELQHAIETRGKKKPLVTITMYETCIRIQYKNQVSTLKIAN